MEATDGLDLEHADSYRELVEGLEATEE